MLSKIEGNPYEAECEWIRVNKNSGRETNASTIAGVIARDSTGRRVEEQSLRDHTGEESLRIAQIYDPSRSVIHILNRQSKTLISVPVAVGESGPSGFGLPTIDLPAIAIAVSLGSVSETDDRILGQEVIEGMTCNGYSRSGPRTKAEYWVSEELQDTIFMRVVAHDFELTFRAYNIRRIEPNSELFSIPSDCQLSSISDCYFRPWPQ